ncbi:OmpP1/FadL family transporter [Mangrovibacterium lignilyticum]|uniref:OmpP1/FadL family transporter n=1 Tax=Mangrovibacterium lignilyticum TaxID=2668052 RepID=UPI0013D74242|nr:outer membrane protein transport protein [Mangrovibacterium lignilyticum]
MKISKRLTQLLICLFLMAFVSTSAGQDGHHWTEQFGASSMFLGGSVIGGVSDLGAVYYNPGRLSQMDQQVFVFSGNAYEISSFKVKDLVGDKGYSKSDFKGVPNLTAGTFKVSFLKKHYFAWAVLVKSNSNINIAIQDDRYGDIFTTTPGNEYFNSSLNLINKLKNTWSCLSWSYPLNDHLSVGATAAYSHIKNEKGSMLDMAALNEENKNAATYSYNKNYNFSFNGLLLKTGISYQYDDGLLGITFLTPIMKIKGKGNYTNENYASGLDNFSTNPDIYGYTNQKDLNTNYRSPWAIGLGISQHLQKNTIHIGVEWYSKVGAYTVINPNDYVTQSSGTTVLYAVSDNQKSIVNYGIGVELYISETLRSYASFYSDYSSIEKYAENSNMSVLNPINSNFFHIGGGILLDLKGTSLSLGLTHSGTKSELSRPLNFPSIDLISQKDDNTTIAWNRWRIMFSLSVPLFKDIQNKLGL